MRWSLSFESQNRLAHNLPQKTSSIVFIFYLNLLQLGTTREQGERIPGRNHRRHIVQQHAVG